MAPTVSGAGCSSIATGAWPDKHKVVDNNFTAPNYGQYPDYLSRLETAQSKASTLVVGTWSPIPQKVFGEKVALRIAGGNDAAPRQRLWTTSLTAIRTARSSTWMKWTEPDTPTAPNTRNILQPYAKWMAR